MQYKYSILAIDPGFNVGLAFAKKGGDKIQTSTINLGFVKQDFGELSGVFREKLSDYIQCLEPDLVVVEKQFMRGASTYHLFGLEWDTHAVAKMHHIRRYGVRPTSVKTRLTGSGRSQKKDMIMAARQYCEISNDHEADAVGLLLCGQDYLIGNHG